MQKPKKNNSNEQISQLSKALQERDRFQKDAANYKRLYESQQGYNKKISDRLAHTERQVRALTDALTDKYCPVPVEFKVSMDCRVVKPEGEQP